jgi:hypothetical protein
VVVTGLAPRTRWRPPFLSSQHTFHTFSTKNSNSILLQGNGVCCWSRFRGTQSCKTCSRRGTYLFALQEGSSNILCSDLLLCPPIRKLKNAANNILKWFEGKRPVNDCKDRCRCATAQRAQCANGSSRNRMAAGWSSF